MAREISIITKRSRHISREPMKSGNRVLPSVSSNYGSTVSRSSFKYGSSRASHSNSDMSSLFSASPDHYMMDNSQLNGQNEKKKSFEDLELQSLTKGVSKKVAPRDYSKVYKDGYIARRDTRGKSSHFPQTQTEMAHDNLRKTKTYYDESKPPKPPSPSPNLELDLHLKHSLNDHRQKYQDFLQLMEKYNNERLRIIREEKPAVKMPKLQPQVKVPVKEEKGLLETIKSLFRKKAVEDVKEVTVKEETEDEDDEDQEEEALDEDPELTKFTDLVKRHNDSYVKFQRLLNQKSVEENQTSGQLLGLRKKHLQMSSAIRNDLDKSFADITVFDLTDEKVKTNT